MAEMFNFFENDPSTNTVKNENKHMFCSSIAWVNF
jgi:hypothetical protein